MAHAGARLTPLPPGAPVFNRTLTFTDTRAKVQAWGIIPADAGDQAWTRETTSAIHAIASVRGVSAGARRLIRTSAKPSSR